MNNKLWSNLIDNQVKRVIKITQRNLQKMTKIYQT